MKISKKDALLWFSFFAQLDEEEELLPKQMELVYATFAQIEDTIDARNEKLMAEIKGLKSIGGRTYFVGPEEKFAKGCRSCMTGTGLTAIRKTNKCNIQCKFCYNYGELEDCMPIGEGLWGNWRHEVLRTGFRPTAFHSGEADRDFLCLPRAVYGD